MLQEGFQQVLGGAVVGAEQAGGGVGVEVRSWHQGQAPEQVLLRAGQVRVGRLEDHGEVAVIVLQPFESALLVAQLLDHVVDGQALVMAQPRRGDPHGQRHLPAQGHEFGGGGIVRRNPAGAGRPVQQGDGLGLREGAQREVVGLVQSGEAAAAGDHDQAARSPRQQQADLGRAGGVVQDDQGSGAGQPVTVDRGTRAQVLGEALRRYPEGVQQPRQ